MRGFPLKLNRVSLIQCSDTPYGPEYDAGANIWSSTLIEKNFDSSGGSMLAVEFHNYAPDDAMTSAGQTL